MPPRLAASGSVRRSRRSIADDWRGGQRSEAGRGECPRSDPRCAGYRIGAPALLGGTAGRGVGVAPGAVPCGGFRYHPTPLPMGSSASASPAAIASRVSARNSPSSRTPSHTSAATIERRSSSVLTAPVLASSRLYSATLVAIGNGQDCVQVPGWSPEKQLRDDLEVALAFFAERYGIEPPEFTVSVIRDLPQAHSTTPSGSPTPGSATSGFRRRSHTSTSISSSAIRRPG